MSKAILMSIQPRWVAEILNGKKTIEVRKKFPKDYVGWVYIYCTKGNGCLDYDIEWKSEKWFWWTEKDYKKVLPNVNKFFNGKVVARFWCDKVEEIECRGSLGNYEGLEINQYYTDTMEDNELFKKSCLKLTDFNGYLDNGKKIGYAIHISKLEVFKEPKELKSYKHLIGYMDFGGLVKPIYDKVEKAPQSYMFIEGE